MLRRSQWCVLGSLGPFAYLLACEACGATKAPATAAPPPPAASVTAACSDLYAALATLSACNTLVSPLGKSERFQAMCEARLGAAGVSAGVLEVAETCAAAVKAAAPACGAVDTTACAVQVGTRPVGAPCGSAMQCASGYCTGPEDNTNDATLSLWQLAPTLESCGTCAERAAAGSACAAVYQCNAGCPVLPAPCAIGFVCSGDLSSGSTGVTSGQGGTCVPEPAPASSPAPPPSTGALAGDACTTTDAGTSNCVYPLLCDAQTSRCAMPTPAAPGAPCGAANNFLCQTGLCSFQGATGTCPLVLADGQPCSVAASAGTCDDYAQCVEPRSVEGCCFGSGTGSSSSGGSSSGGGTGGGGPASEDASVASFDAGAGAACLLFDPRSCG